MTITNNVEVDGPGAGQLAVSGQGASRVFVIDGGSYGGASKVTIKDLTIEDGLATSDLDFPPSGGGILDLMASLKLRDCVLNANQALLGGAGAMIYRGSLDDSGSTWTNNVILGNASSTTVGSDTLGYNGSGFDVFASAAISGDSSFTSNTFLYPASTYGGGISAEEGSTLSVSGADIQRKSGQRRRSYLGAGGSDAQRLRWHVRWESGLLWRRHRGHRHRRHRSQLILHRE